MNYFTKDEQTIRKHNADFMVKQARAVLASTHNYHGGICVNALPAGDGLYTVEQSSQIIEQIIDDTLYSR